jgi:hypothetical protein
MNGTAAEALWIEGEASYVLAGRASRAEVTAPPPDLIGWIAFCDGEPAAISACRIVGTEAHALLSYCRPTFRRRGLFKELQAVRRADLRDINCTVMRSWVVDGPDAHAMADAIMAHGGVLMGERMVAGLAGPVRYDEYSTDLT